VSLKEIQDLLKKTSARRDARETAARAITNSPEGCITLMEAIIRGNTEIRVKGCWVLEIVLLEHPELLGAHRTRFFELISTLTTGSAIRPTAKVVATWCDAVFSGKHTAYPAFAPEEPDLLARHCFTWLLDDHPVAVKVYSMEALYHLGKEIGWIHPELRAYLTMHFPEGSPAFQARAKRLLKKL
jgi:hypothetical protein